MIDEITSIDQICNLAKSGFSDWRKFGEVYARKYGSLIIFNYTEKAQFDARWNFFETISRGLIVDCETGEISARAFDKFYNWGEGGRTSHGKIVSVTEKIDGSLGILYRDGGQYNIATRGSLDGEQAIWATQFIQKYNLSGLPDEYTLLFEIVYPENRIVVDYGDKQDLILLAVRNRFSGDYIPRHEVEQIAARCGFSTTPVYSFSDVAEILTGLPELDGNQEGYVVEFSDGQRFKFKGDRYKELHRLICGLSFKNTLAAVAAGTVENIRSQIPDEFLLQFNAWVNEIEERVDDIKYKTGRAFEKAPKETRKDFAIWVNQNHKELSAFLFAMLDGREITPLIFRSAFDE